MAEAKYQLTPEGRADLIRELEERERKRQEIIESLREARGFGDLSENAEFDAAKDEQSKNETRINEIKYQLDNAVIIDTSKGDVFSVSINTTVVLEDPKGKASTFSIVGTTETDPLNNKISNESPLGSALLGRMVGDEISYATPSGRVRTFRIVSIEPTERAAE